MLLLFLLYNVYVFVIKTNTKFLKKGKIAVLRISLLLIKNEPPKLPWYLMGYQYSVVCVYEIRKSIFTVIKFCYNCCYYHYCYCCCCCCSNFIFSFFFLLFCLTTTIILITYLRATVLCCSCAWAFVVFKSSQVFLCLYNYAKVAPYL